MIITIYTDDGEKYTFLEVKEFAVAGPMQISGTSEVEFGKHGFRFTDNKEGKSNDNGTA